VNHAIYPAIFRIAGFLFCSGAGQKQTGLEKGADLMQKLLL
jgi:hypothetical protein